MSPNLASVGDVMFVSTGMADTICFRSSPGFSVCDIGAGTKVVAGRSCGLEAVLGVGVKVDAGWGELVATVGLGEVIFLFV